MLTKDLVRYRIKKEEILPTFVDPEDEGLLQIAQELIAVFEESPGQTRNTLTQLVKPIIDAGPREAVVSRGLEKLLLDRTIFETPDDEARPKFRASIFQKTSRALGTDFFDSYEAYGNWVRETFDHDLEIMAGKLFSDLPDQHPVLSFKTLTAGRLLHRYNSALIQWLLLSCNRMDVEVSGSGAASMRQLLKYLRFNQLLARITSPGKGVYHIAIDGPLNLFYQTRKYGMNLARFFPALLHQSKWRLVAPIEINSRRKGRLELDESVGIIPDRERFLAYVPREIDLFRKPFRKKAPDWRMESNPRFVRLQGEVQCFPDFSLVHVSGVPVALELFHPWHASPLTERLQQLEQVKGHPLILGVARKLANDPLIAAALETSAYFADFGFVFRDIPTVGQVLPILARCL